MKLHLLDRSSSKNSSFSAKRNLYSNFLKTWHYHAELELVAIIQSKGTRFIGDHIGKFEPGELILIGKNLPHMWHNEPVYFDKSNQLSAEAIAVHFKEDFLGNDFLKIPEMNKISKLLERSALGIRFNNIPTKIIDKVKKIPKLDGFEKTILFIDILYRLANHRSYSILSSVGFVNSFRGAKNKQLNSVYEYLYKNFTKTISLTDVAAIAHMNPSAFSRFFKRVHRKTFSRYLNEIRVGYACKMLIEEEKNITSICYDSGYNNISNFNRQFKNVKGISPSQFLRQYRLNKS